MSRVAALPEALADAVVAHTEGVPLFLEELTKAVAEGDASALGAIPATLADSLMARLDRLGPAKEVAQMASVCGREFSYELLRAVALLPGDQLDVALRRLCDAELLYARGVAPEATYLFKHALVQEAAYASLLRSRRRELHARVAAELRAKAEDVAEAQPELVAHHLTEAGESEAAVSAWQEAGDRARDRGAIAESAEHFARALEVLASLPESPSRMQRELDVQIRRAQAFELIVGWAAPETTAAYSRASELTSQLGDSRHARSALAGLSLAAWSRGDLRTAEGLAGRLIALAEKSGDRVALSRAHGMMAVVLRYRGDAIRTLDHALKAVALSDKGTDAPDPGLLYASLASVWLGMIGKAREHLGAGLELAERQQLLVARLEPHIVASGVYRLLGELSPALEHAEWTIAISTEHKFPAWHAVGLAYRGKVLVAMGRADEGAADLRAAIRGNVATGSRVGLASYLAWLADALGHAGELDEALSTVDAGLAALTEQEGDHAELLVLRGDLLRQTGGDPDRIEADYRDALAINRPLGNKLFELHATTSLSRFLHSRGRTAEAREILVPLYASFTEGFEIPILVEAKAVLDSVS